jgi:hypothetical protein
LDKNKQVIGEKKDETAAKPINEFIGQRAETTLALKRLKVLENPSLKHLTSPLPIWGFAAICRIPHYHNLGNWEPRMGRPSGTKGNFGNVNFVL